MLQTLHSPRIVAAELNESTLRQEFITQCINRYGELEAVSLGQDLAAPQIPSATDDAEAAVAAIGAAAAAAETAVAAAVERCRAATGLAGIPELQLVADEELAQFVSRLQVTILSKPSTMCRYRMTFSEARKTESVNRDRS